MSDTTLQYTDLHLYTERGSSDSITFRSWLNGQNVPFVDLDYSSDAVEDALSPLRTWTFANDDVQVNFASMPVLVYKEVLWESPDKTDKYEKDYYASSSNDLPSDFLEKVV